MGVIDGLPLIEDYTAASGPARFAVLSDDGNALAKGRLVVMTAPSAIGAAVPVMFVAEHLEDA